MKVAIVILLLMIILFGKRRSNNKAKSIICGIARKSLIHESQLRHRKKKKHKKLQRNENDFSKKNLSRTFHFMQLWRKNCFWFNLRKNKNNNSKNEEAFPSNFASSAYVVGLDCEMVGVGRGGYESALARCSIVTMRNDKVKVLYDTYVKPDKKITDYRTQFSGINKHHLSCDKVKSLAKCRMDVAEILSCDVDGKMALVVGHALENNFRVLKLDHPIKLVRDTTTYPAFMRPYRGKKYPRKLSSLVKEHLDIEIQNNGSKNLTIINDVYCEKIALDIVAWRMLLLLLCFIERFHMIGKRRWVFQ